MSDGQPILEVCGVSRSVGGVRALRSGKFSVKWGKIVATVGGHGAGRSTLIKIVADDTDPKSVAWSSKGMPSSHAAKDLPPTTTRRRICVMGLAVVPNMTASYNLILGRIPQRRPRVSAYSGIRNLPGQEATRRTQFRLETSE